MCIGCRRKRKKAEMVQFVKGTDGVVLVNEKKRIHGRGFYLCPDLSCLGKAEKREKGIGFLRSLDPLREGLEQRRKGNGQD
jgi:predicted RNA-binding protein YlxR (DUF448 family)